MSIRHASLVKVRHSMVSLAHKALSASAENSSPVHADLREALRSELGRFEQTVDGITSRPEPVKITKKVLRVVLTSVNTLNSTLQALRGTAPPARIEWQSQAIGSYARG